MEQWEFLLQKEGDRSWLPLDSPDVEILEGRYRIVARSSYPSTDVEVRITHLATEEHPPKRRVQKRTSRTNPEGLLVVIPFTRLEPGSWELRCSSLDLMSDLAGKAWCYTIQLQVSATEAEEEQWEPTWTDSTPIAAASEGENQTKGESEEQPDRSGEQPQSPAIQENPETIPIPFSASSEQETSPTETPSLPTEVSEILGASMDRLFQIADQMSSQLVDEVLQTINLNSDAGASSPNAASPSTPETAATEISTPIYTVSGMSSSLPLPAGMVPLIRLEQEVLIAQQNTPLTLSGSIDLELMAEEDQSLEGKSGIETATPAIADPWETGQAPSPTRTAHELQLCLRDPQSLQVLVSDRQPLPNQPLPCNFSFSFSLPIGINTRLLLGEVLLCGTVTGGGDELMALTTQSFTVTADPAELVDELEKISEVLDETVTQEVEGDRIDLPMEISQRLTQELPSLRLSFLEPDPEEVGAENDTELSRYTSLAGQPLPPQIYHPSPDEVREKMVVLPGLGSKLAVEDQPASLPVKEPVDETGKESAPTQSGEEGEPVVAAEPVLPQPEEILQVEVEAAEPVEAEASSIDLPSPIQMAFQSLRLQDRFLSRLNSIANDEELSDWLRSNLYPGKANVSPETPEVTSKAENLAKKRLSEEIVVDDEPEAVVPHPKVRSLRTQKVTTTEPNPLILPPNKPVPTPTLEVTSGELVAGQLVRVRIRLPYLQQRIYTKLWLVDLQNRSLLDGPRWLLDFFPNSAGELEAITQLSVPFGSLEIRFEAVAIEMHTQRESHKVSVDRSVVPPDLPVVSLDDLNV
jgi:hypothetical protein